MRGAAQSYSFLMSPFSFRRETHGDNAAHTLDSGGALILYGATSAQRVPRARRRRRGAYRQRVRRREVGAGAGGGPAGAGGREGATYRADTSPLRPLERGVTAAGRDGRRGGASRRRGRLSAELAGGGASGYRGP